MDGMMNDTGGFAEQFWRLAHPSNEERPAFHDVLRSIARVARRWSAQGGIQLDAPAAGIGTVRYAGYQWSETAGGRGWTRDRAAPSGSVELR